MRSLEINKSSISVDDAFHTTYQWKISERMATIFYILRNIPFMQMTFIIKIKRCQFVAEISNKLLMFLTAS